MILDTGAVHTHLIRQKLRTFVSLNVRPGECLDVHYFAVLIGVGATTVNAYLAQESIAESHRTCLFDDPLLAELAQSYIMAVHSGLLHILAQHGLAFISPLPRAC